MVTPSPITWRRGFLLEKSTADADARYMKLYIFNGLYAVLASSFDEAKTKLGPHLVPDHKWYLREGVENPQEQGHLTVREIALVNGVAKLR